MVRVSLAAFVAMWVSLAWRITYLADLQDQSDAFKCVYSDTSECLASCLCVASNVNIRGYRGNTLLTLATGNGRIENVRYLLSRGADTTMRNGAGDTALDIARQHGYTEIIRLLESE